MPSSRPGSAITVDAMPAVTEPTTREGERVTTELPSLDAAGLKTQLEVPVAQLSMEQIDALIVAAVEQNDFGSARDALKSLMNLPVEADGRHQRLTRVATLLDEQFHSEALALQAWQAVLVKNPKAEIALWCCVDLSRQLQRDEDFSRHAEQWLQHFSSNPKSRLVRLEWVGTLERLNRDDEALKVLKGAVEADPRDADAWCALAERLVSAAQTADAMRAYEKCVEVSGDQAQRLFVLNRLIRLTRLHLGDEARAQKYLAQSEQIKAQQPVPLPDGPLAGPLVLPPVGDDSGAVAEAPEDDPFEEVAAMLEARSEEPSDAPATVTEVITAEAPDPAPVDAADETSDEVPAEGADAERHETLEVPALGDPSIAVVPSFGPSPGKALSAERAALFERVQTDPLDVDGYKLLAEHYDAAADVPRSALMLEIARALEGDPHAAPRAPRLILNAGDREGLKHPLLRGPEAEYLSLMGIAMCRLYPAKGRDAGTQQEFTLESGKGARVATEALVAAVRILGVRSPDVYLAEDAGPPFSLVFTGSARVLVGKQAIRKPAPDAELRFFAGRALFTQAPELLVTRSLRREQLLKALNAVQQVIEGASTGAEAKVIRDSITARAWEKLKVLHLQVGKALDVGKLIDGARHSSNRAGLVVCGGVAPAVDALRAKKALPAEMIELIRFAGSDRYLQLRGRKF